MGQAVQRPSFSHHKTFTGQGEGGGGGGLTRGMNEVIRQVACRPHLIDPSSMPPAVGPSGVAQVQDTAASSAATAKALTGVPPSALSAHRALLDSLAPLPGSLTTLIPLQVSLPGHPQTPSRRPTSWRQEWPGKFGAHRNFAPRVNCIPGTRHAMPLGPGLMGGLQIRITGLN